MEKIFSPEYRAYMESEEWKAIRRVVMYNAKWICSHCLRYIGRTGDVHHLRYPPDIYDTRPEDCRYLCRACHDKVHEVLDLKPIPYFRKIPRRKKNNLSRKDYKKFIRSNPL